MPITNDVTKAFSFKVTKIEVCAQGQSFDPPETQVLVPPMFSDFGYQRTTMGLKNQDAAVNVYAQKHAVTFTMKQAGRVAIYDTLNGMGDVDVRWTASNSQETITETLFNVRLEQILTHDKFREIKLKAEVILTAAGDRVTTTSASLQYRPVLKAWPGQLVRASNVVTYTGDVPHNLLSIATVTIAHDATNTSATDFAAAGKVITVVDAYSFTYAQTGTDESNLELCTLTGALKTLDVPLLGYKLGRVGLKDVVSDVNDSLYERIRGRKGSCEIVIAPSYFAGLGTDTHGAITAGRGFGTALQSWLDADEKYLRTFDYHDFRTDATNGYRRCVVPDAEHQKQAAQEDLQLSATVQIAVLDKDKKRV